MITRQEYVSANRKLNGINIKTDTKEWNMLCFRIHPDKALQEKFNSLCDITAEYERQQEFCELLSSGDYRTC